VLDSYREQYGVCCDLSPPVPQKCGVRNPDGVASFSGVANVAQRIQNPSLLPANEARFAEFPWQAMIYKNLFPKPAESPSGKAEAQFVCGATLVSERFLITAAHCIKK
jgi:secreted trypsin-like serine protease